MSGASRTDHEDLTAYESLVEVAGDARWAFGTGFVDALDGVDTALPDRVDGSDLAAYCLALGDDALALSQRLVEWCTRAPELEEEVALANIALDLLGQARLFYGRAGYAEGAGRDEDALAFLRGPDEFRNVHLAELPNGDFAACVGRLLMMSAWRLALMERLSASADPVVAAIAAKAAKELAYHRDYSGRWVVRLGDGTEESRRRMVAALAGLWPYLDELFRVTPIEARLSGVAVEPGDVRADVEGVIDQVLGAASLDRPMASPAAGGGRAGRHTAHLAPMLDEMQAVARAHAGAAW